MTEIKLKLMEDTEQTIKIIEAIGQQWPFLITVFVIIVIIIKWKSIWNGLEKFKRIKVKKGDAEFEIDKDANEKEEQNQTSPENISKPKENSEIIERKENTLFDCYLKLSEGEKEEAQKVFEEVQSTAKEQDKFYNEVIFNYYKFLHGDTHSIETLLKFNSEENISTSNKYHVNYFLGLCYRKSSNRSLAINYFEESEKLAKDDKQKTDCAINIANVYSDNELYDEAMVKLLKSLKLISDNSSLAEIYNNLSTVYKNKENPDLSIAFLEKAIGLYPNDVSSLFNLAYDYSNSNYDDASIFHYLNLLSFNANHSMALNNIGYGFSRKGMQFSSVEYYKKAIEQPNTLAVGNLCFKYINEGFQKEAEDLIERFKDEKELDQMVVKAQDEILNIKRKEEQKLNEIKKTGNKYSEFFQFYSDCILNLEKLENYNSKDWTDEEKNNISVLVTKHELSIKWSKYNKVLESDDDFEIKGKLSINGCIIEYSIPETIKPGFFSTLNFNDKKEPYRSIKTHTGQCIIDLDKGIIKVLFKDDKENKFKTITKKTSA